MNVELYRLAKALKDECQGANCECCPLYGNLCDVEGIHEQPPWKWDLSKAEQAQKGRED